MAARNAYNAMVSENAANAAQRVPAANAQGIPLNMAEATGSPIHAQMMNQAAMSDEGSKVIYPWALMRQQAENNTMRNTANSISPNYRSTGNGALPFSSANTMEEAAYRHSFDIADQNNTRVNVQPVINYIDQQLPRYQENSNIAQALRRARTALNVTPHTEAELLRTGQPAQDYENTLEGLHNAKLGIRGILESQGENAIGNTAAGVLKQVNRRLNARMTAASPQYASANNISNMRQAREQIDKVMAEPDITGKDFYTKILKNNDEYTKLYDRLENPNNPNIPTQAQNALEHLKTAMPDLMDNLALTSGKALAKEHPDSNFKLLDLAKTFTNKVFMNRYNKAVAELMTNPRWQDELDKVARMKQGEDRGISLGRLISKVNVAGGAAYGNQQGSEKNGDNINARR